MKNQRFSQANKEALFTLALYALYFLWWYGFAYGLGSGDPKDYSYILGFPAWFFLSCIAGCPVLSLLLWLVLRKYFRDMPLDSHTDAHTDIHTEIHTDTHLDSKPAAHNGDADADCENKKTAGESHV
jgi:uncharacterized membrane protein YhdT